MKPYNYAISLVFTILLSMLVVFVVTGAGCTTTPLSSTQQQDIAYTCSGISAAEDALVLYNAQHPVTDAVRAKVRSAIAFKKPICDVSPMPSSIPGTEYKLLSGALDTLRSAVPAQ